jgi:ATP phosphoribosyltransferase
MIQDMDDALLKLGLPKGSLQDTTIDLFRRAGYNIQVSGRNYFPKIDDDEISCLMVRAQEMARYVEQGVMDVGITGIDWVQENSADVVELADLKAPWSNYRPVRWVLAVKHGSPFKSIKDLEGKRIAAEAIGLTKKYFSENGVSAEFEFSWGATEVKPPVLADAIVDVSETGSSLRANNLDVLAVLLESTPRLIANKEAYADPAKRKKMEHLKMLLLGAIEAADRVGLMMNVPDGKLDALLALFPKGSTPTVSPLHGGGGVDLNLVIREKLVRDLIPNLISAGATGIVEYPLNKVVG